MLGIAAFDILKIKAGKIPPHEFRSLIVDINGEEVCAEEADEIPVDGFLINVEVIDECPHPADDPSDYQEFYNSAGPLLHLVKSEGVKIDTDETVRVFALVDGHVFDDGSVSWDRIIGLINLETLADGKGLGKLVYPRLASVPARPTAK